MHYDGTSSESPEDSLQISPYAVFSFDNNRLANLLTLSALPEDLVCVDVLSQNYGFDTHKQSLSRRCQATFLFLMRV